MRRDNHWQNDPSCRSEINLGFGPYERQEQQRYGSNNRSHWQILMPQSQKEELQKPKLCTQCHSPIDYIPESQKWICYTCQLTWNIGFDTPLTNTDNAIKPLQSNDPYERQSPKIISINPNRRLQGEHDDSIREITRVSGGGRKVHVKVKGSPALVTEEWIREQLKGDTAYGY
jgi:ribosomal protein L37AE/L43A